MPARFTAPNIRQSQPSGWAGVFVRIGAASLPIVLLAAVAAVRIDAHVAMPSWLRAAAFMGIGMTIGVALWGWVVLRPRRVWAGVLAAVFAVFSIAFIPHAADRLCRFIVPWYVARSDTDWTLTVASGDPVVRIGDAVTVTAYLDRNHPTVPLPTDARCEFGDESAPRPMIADGRGTFRVTLPAVNSPVSYRVVVGELASGWHTITPANPVDLADGTSLRVIPPAYAPNAPRRLIEGFRTTNAYPSGELEVRLRFTRPPVQVSLDWSPVHGESRVPEPIPVSLDEDRLGAEVRIPVGDGGGLTLRTIAEHGLATEFHAPIFVAEDNPPVWDMIDGLGAYPLQIRPGERPSIEFAVRDDLGIAAVRCEYRINEAETISVRAADESHLGSTLVRGRVRIPIPDHVRIGDQVSVRLIARDNRPSVNPDDQKRESRYPSARWAVFAIRGDAPDVGDQHIRGQRAELNRVLGEAATLIRGTIGHVADLSAETTRQHTLDHSVRVSAVVSELDRSSQRLGDAIRSAVMRPDLYPVAVAMREIDRDLVRYAIRELVRSTSVIDEPVSESRIIEAGRALETARRKLDRLSKTVERRTELRLAKLRLDSLAGAAVELADRPNHLAELSPHQRELYRQLRELIQSNTQLRALLAFARQAECAQIANGLTQLKSDIEMLADAIDATDAKRMSSATSPIEDECRRLSARLATYATRSREPLRIVDARPVDERWLAAARRELEAGGLPNAMTELEKAAREMDRVALVTRRSVAARADASETARQLAAWLAIVETRVSDRGTQPLDDAKLHDLRREISAVLTVLKAMSSANTVGPDALTTADAEAALRSVLAIDPGTISEAADRLARARGAVVTLVDRLPTRAETLSEARITLDDLSQDQQQLVGACRRAIDDPNADQATFTILAARQAAVGDRLREVHAPAHGHRIKAAVAAITAAEEDLKRGRRSDIPVSVGHALIQIDRYRQAVSGAVPDDERVRELAELFQSYSTMIAQADDPTAALTGPVGRRLHRELLRQFTVFSAPIALPLLDDVRDHLARMTRSNSPDSADTPRNKIARTGVLVARLAHRLDGTETDHERIRDLITTATAAEDREKLAARLAPSPDDANRYLADLRQYESVLKITRAGKAQAEMAAVALALAELRGADPFVRQPKFVGRMAEALRHLAEAMARNGDRDEGSPLSAPTRPKDPAQGVERCPLLTEADAATADAIAAELRRVRDRVSRVQSELAFGVRPADGDPLSESRNRLIEYRNSVRHDFPNDGPPTVENAQIIADVTSLIELLAVGHPATSAKAELIANDMGNPDADREFRVLLSQTIDRSANIANLVARQISRESELADTTADLSRRFEAVVRETEETGPFQDSDAVKTAAERMHRAERQLRNKNRDVGPAKADDVRSVAGEFDEALAMMVNLHPIPTPTNNDNRLEIVEHLTRAKRSLQSSMDENQTMAERRRQLKSVGSALREASRLVAEVIVSTVN